MDGELEQLGEHIAELAAHLDAATHRLLTDLRAFDQRGGWHVQGAMSCAHWLSWRVGWDLVTARERVRIAARLGELPVIDDALRRGAVSYSKVRAMARVATPANETLLLAHAELMTAAQLEKLSRKYALVQRHGAELHPLIDVQRRRVRRRDTEDGMVKIEAVLHPEEAELVWAMLDHAAARLASDRQSTADGCAESEPARDPGAESAEAGAGAPCQRGRAGAGSEGARAGGGEGHAGRAGVARVETVSAAGDDSAEAGCEAEAGARGAGAAGTCRASTGRAEAYAGCPAVARGEAVSAAGDDSAEAGCGAEAGAGDCGGGDRAGAGVDRATGGRAEAGAGRAAVARGEAVSAAGDDSAEAGCGAEAGALDCCVRGRAEAGTCGVCAGRAGAGADRATVARGEAVSAAGDDSAEAGCGAEAGARDCGGGDRAGAGVDRATGGRAEAGAGRAAVVRSEAVSAAGDDSAGCGAEAGALDCCGRGRAEAGTCGVCAGRGGAGADRAAVARVETVSAARDDSAEAGCGAEAGARDCGAGDRAGAGVDRATGVRARAGAGRAAVARGESTGCAAGSDQACVEPVEGAAAGRRGVHGMPGPATDSSESRPPSVLQERVNTTRRGFDRADALVALAQGYLRGDRSNRSPVEVMVTITAGGVRGESPDSVAEIGGSFVSLETARRLACDAGVIEVVAGADGEPLSVGRKRRTITGALKRALRDRDTTCTFPGCTHRMFLEGHHIQHWAAGGETSLRNTALLCDWHHRHVHEYGYTIALGADQRPRFYDPEGRAVPAVPARPVPLDLGWPWIRAANAALEIDAATAACGWDGKPAPYGAIVGHLLAADGAA